MLLQFLIVGLQLHPVAGATVAQDVLSDLVKDKDEEGEGGGGEPPVDLERVHLQPLVHAGGVGEEGRQQGLEHQAKVHDPVLHSLKEKRKILKRLSLQNLRCLKVIHYIDQ